MQRSETEGEETHSSIPTKFPKSDKDSISLNTVTEVVYPTDSESAPTIFRGAPDQFSEPERMVMILSKIVPGSEVPEAAEKLLKIRTARMALVAIGGGGIMLVALAGLITSISGEIIFPVTLPMVVVGGLLAAIGLISSLGNMGPLSEAGIPIKDITKVVEASKRSNEKRKPHGK